MSESIASEPRRPRVQEASWFLGIAAAVAFVPIGLWNLGFVRDDWNHYVNMRDLHSAMPWWEAVSLLASNEWFGAHELRIFFGSFLAHYLIAPLGELAPLAAYLWLLSLHVGAALLAAWCLWRLLQSQVLSLAAMILLTYWPTISQPALWLNNLFFVQPWFFLTLTVALAILLWRRPVPMAFAVSAAALAAAFSGEAAIPVLLGTLFVLPVAMFVLTRSLKQASWACVPLGSVIAALAAYLAWIVVWPASSPLDVTRLAEFGTYLASARDQFMNLVSPGSAQFGAGSITPSISTWAIVLALMVAVALAIFLGRTAVAGAQWRRRWVIGLVLSGGLLLAVFPWAMGVVTGSRPGPDLRYLYVPSAFLVLLLVLVLDCVASVRFRWATWTGKSAVVLVSALALYTTIFNITVVWSLQRDVDERIWSEVRKHLGPSTHSIVTFHPQHPYLMAPYHSNAVSDFQADWGLAGRISWENPSWLRVGVYRDAEVINGEVVGRHYYDSGTTCLGHESGSGDVIFMTYDYGPYLGDLYGSPLLVTTDVSEFIASRNALLEASEAPTRPPWGVCDGAR
jgi:hypothetical protein